jgi:hypothetical protein
VLNSPGHLRLKVGDLRQVYLPPRVLRIFAAG